MDEQELSVMDKYIPLWLKFKHDERIEYALKFGKIPNTGSSGNHVLGDNKWQQF